MRRIRRDVTLFSNVLFHDFYTGGPLEPWFDKTWRAGEFELAK